MPAHPPKRKRLSLLNITLALALGTIIWWCVDSWLGIKPDYLLRFPNRGELPNDRKGYKTPFSFYAQAADVEEKYLVLQRPNFPGAQVITTELRDLRTGHAIVSHQETLHERYNSIIDYSMPHELANANGSLILMAMEKSSDTFKGYSVCEWNLITNKRSVLVPYAPGTWFHLREGVSKLVATTILSPFMPSIIGPPGWANLFPLAVLADTVTDFHKSGLVLVRVYSLPDTTLSQSCVLPAPCGLSINVITPDGSGLLVGSAVMSPANIFDTLDFDAIQRLQPKGLAVYDLASGQLRQRIADHPGEVSYFHQWCDLGGNLVEVILKNDPYQKVIAPKKEMKEENEERIEELVHRVREHQVAYYHLPTNRWLNLDGDRALSIVSSNQFDRMFSHDKSTDNWRVWQINRDGASTQLSWLSCQISNDAQLLDASNQMAFIRVRYGHLPRWLQDVKGTLRTVLYWFERPSFSLVFYDYLQDRELGAYRLGSNEPGKLMKSANGNYLILNTTNETEHEVAVFSLPVKPWSPWWARSAGIVTGLLVLLLLFRSSIRNTRASN